MSVIFSKSCEYAIQAALYLATKSEGVPVHLREIADNLQIPQHFLSKILQTLTRDEIVVSQKGSHGGFKLGRPAAAITVGDIVRAVDGEAFLSQCVLGFPACGDDFPCPVHDSWKDAKDRILEMLHASNLDILSQRLGGKLNLLNDLSSA